MLDDDNRLRDEDFSTLVERFDDGPCGQLSVVMSCVLNKFLREAIMELNHGLSMVIDTRADYSNCEYRFRNAFECGCWLTCGSQSFDFLDEREDVNREVRVSVCQAVSRIGDFLERRLLAAWFWQSIDQRKIDGLETVMDADEKLIEELVVDVVVRRLDEQMRKTAEFVDGEIDFANEKFTARKHEQFEYDDDDHYMEWVLEQMAGRCPKNKDVKSALEYVRKFLDKRLTDEEPMTIGVSCRIDGDLEYVDFSLNEDELTITHGGCIHSEAGGDSYSEEVWRLESFNHARYPDMDIADVVDGLIARGGEVSLG